MITLGLIGWPVSHSLSPTIHNAALRENHIKGEYCLFPIDPEKPDSLKEILDRVRMGEIVGLNVTIPHKQNVIPFLDELSPSARSIGAVNTIYRVNGALVGHNTDAPGFLNDLRQKSGIMSFANKNVLVLGAGGSARAVVWALTGLSCHINLAVRDISKGKALVEKLIPASAEASLRTISLSEESLKPLLDSLDIVVNTTPVGMSPNIEASPWPIQLPFPNSAFIYDLIYNPRQTKFVETARNNGLRASNGLGMLVEQAALAFEIWMDIPAPRDQMYSVI